VVPCHWLSSTCTVLHHTLSRHLCVVYIALFQGEVSMLFKDNGDGTGTAEAPREVGRPRRTNTVGAVKACACHSGRRVAGDWLPDLCPGSLVAVPRVTQHIIIIPLLPLMEQVQPNHTPGERWAQSTLSHIRSHSLARSCLLLVAHRTRGPVSAGHPQTGGQAGQGGSVPPRQRQSPSKSAVLLKL
jgi:hypothetical protein